MAQGRAECGDVGPDTLFSGRFRSPRGSAGPVTRGGRKMYPCRNCGKLFNYGHSMIRHRRQCEGSFHLRCDYCGQMFHRRDRLNTHLQIRHQVRAAPVYYQYGAEPGDSAPLFALGLQEEEEGSSAWFGHKPGSSSFLTPRRRLLRPEHHNRVQQVRAHVSTHSVSTTPSGENSPAMILLKDDERSSFSLLRGAVGFRHYCRNCGKGFAYSHSMMRHRRKCEGSYSYNCQLCGKLFHRRDLYVDHMSSNHNIVDVPRHRQTLSLVDQAALLSSALAMDDLAPQGSETSDVLMSESKEEESAEPVLSEGPQLIVHQPVAVDYTAAANDQEEG
ncbi:hypothetical protein ACOMHN_055144 [Nucella lapillus]